MDAKVADGTMVSGMGLIAQRLASLKPNLRHGPSRSRVTYDRRRDLLHLFHEQAGNQCCHDDAL